MSDNLSPAAPLVPPGFFRNMLARGWVLLVLATLIGGGAGLLRSSRTPRVYRGEAVVLATQTSISSADFGNLARTAFATNTVLEPVIRQLGLNTTPQQLLAKGTLLAESVPGTVALRIVGQSSDPKRAADLANAGAHSFVSAAETTGIGSFTVFSTSSTGIAESHHRSLGIIQGAALGLLLSSLILLLSSIRRRPILSLHDAQRELPAEHVFTVRTDRRILRPRRQAGADGRVHPRGAIRAVWRAVGAEGTTHGPSCCVVLVGSGPSLGRGVGINAVLKALTQDYWLDSSEDEERLPFVWVRAGDRSLATKLENTKVAVTVVSKGASSRAVQDLEQELSVAPSIDSTILVFVR